MQYPAVSYLPFGNKEVLVALYGNSLGALKRTTFDI